MRKPNLEMILDYVEVYNTEEEKIAYIQGVIIALYQTMKYDIAKQYEEGIYNYCKDVYNIQFKNSHTYGVYIDTL